MLPGNRPRETGTLDVERVVPIRGLAGRPCGRPGERILRVVSAFSGFPVDATWCSGDHTGVGLGSRGKPI